eukprot:585546-Ditylum_brightwellii.AAC.1
MALEASPKCRRPLGKGNEIIDINIYVGEELVDIARSQVGAECTQLCLVEITGDPQGSVI